MLNDALVVANMALEISPKFVVLHFTMANIYASKVRLESSVRLSVECDFKFCCTACSISSRLVDFFPGSSIIC